MKPIELTLKGLNNFSDTQVIDFVTLTKQGLFGIFGPTGSGKSTILDGITLALYGEIARKSDNFINVNCNIAAVKFIFSIVDDNSNIITYMVEREFTKTSNGNKSSARLSKHHNDHCIVLAEKVKEVNSKCEQLIGLNFEDFSRTVVLPQGQFSEFFKLTGRPKRDMLERLFNLEKYGNVLTDRVKDKLTSTQSKYDFLTGELSTYDSELLSSLESKNTELLELKSQQSKLKTDLEDVTKTYESCKSIWDNQEKLSSWLKKKDSLDKQNKEIEDEQLKLDKAKVAEKIYPLITNVEEILKKLNTTLDQRQSLEKDMLEVEAMQKISEKAYELALKQKDTDQQDLILKKANLQHIQEIVSQLNITLKDISRLEKEQALLSDNKKLECDKLSSILSDLEKLEETIKNKQLKLKELSCDLNFKDTVFKGCDLSGQYTRLETELNKKTLSLNNLSKMITDLTTKQNSLIDLGTKTKTALNEATKQKNDWDAQLKDLEIKHLADKLRSNLLDGQPCPVCGSTEYNAIIIENVSLDNINILQSQIQNVNLSVKKLELELQYVTENYKVTSARIKDNQSIWTNLEKENQELANNLNLLRNELLKISTQINVNIQDFTTKRHEIELNERSAFALNQDIAQNQQVYLSIKSKQTQIDAVINDYNNKLIASQTSIKSKMEQVESFKSKIQNETGSENIPNVDAIINDLDKQIQKIRLNFETAQKNKKDIDDKIMAISQSRASILNTLHLLSTDYESALNKQNEQLSLHQCDVQMVKNSYLDDSNKLTLEQKIYNYTEEKNKVLGVIESLNEHLVEKKVSSQEWKQIQLIKHSMESHLAKMNEKEILLTNEIKLMSDKKQKFEKLSADFIEAEKQLLNLKALAHLFKGKRFVEFIATNKLKYIVQTASKRLLEITNEEFGMDMNNDNEFIIKDYKNGGVTRCLSSLSGGETFLASLSLALSLSSYMQLKGSTPLELFFLDEGFGTLDNRLLDTVMNSLDNLHGDKLKIGIISHVEAIKHRVPIKLLMLSSNDSDNSRIEMT
ncbi:MAG: hypothetical protein ATN31_08795 [Candidatus Epulonipiscioides saccharophilum]|nr:MAG: hypothetical protein ATN31_08795 [Epulopiscium sp. AS2M-Bin001]